MFNHYPNQTIEWKVEKMKMKCILFEHKYLFIYELCIDSVCTIDFCIDIYNCEFFNNLHQFRGHQKSNTSKKDACIVQKTRCIYMWMSQNYINLN
jgi:hypothetical protein